MTVIKKSLVRDTGWMLLGQGIGYGLRVVYFIVIARLLGVLQYGVVVGAFALVNLVAEQSRLGTGMVLLRYVSPNRNRFASYWGNTLLVTLLMSGVFILTLDVVAPHVLDPASAAIVLVLAIGSCSFEQVTISATQAFMAFQSMRMSAGINQLPSMLRCFTAIGMLLTMHHATAPQWALGSMFASMVAAVVALCAVSVQLGGPRLAPSLAFRHGIEGIQYAFASTTTVAYNDLDKTMLSHFGMNSDNGIYGLAYRIIEMGTAPVMSLQLAAQPRLFQLATDGPREPIILGRRLLRRSLVVNTAIALSLFFGAPLIPFLAGLQFSQAVSALRWLSLILIFRGVHGISGCVLTGIGLQRFRTLNQFLVVALNFGLNLWLIPTYGWHGAAWASLATDGTLGILNWTALEWKGRKSVERFSECGPHGAKGRTCDTVGSQPKGQVIIP